MKQHDDNAETLAVKASPPMMDRQRTVALLMEGAERIRREAHQLEALAFAVKHINGEAEEMLYRMIAAQLLPRR